LLSVVEPLPEAIAAFVTLLALAPPEALPLTLAPGVDAEPLADAPPCTFEPAVDCAGTADEPTKRLNARPIVAA
jgi:hypothetical protein